MEENRKMFQGRIPAKLQHPVEESIDMTIHPHVLPVLRSSWWSYRGRGRLLYKNLQLPFFFFLAPTKVDWRDWSDFGLYSSPTAMVTAMSKISSTPCISLLLHSM
jgi:hypothetical protein